MNYLKYHEAGNQPVEPRDFMRPSLAEKFSGKLEVDDKAFYEREKIAILKMLVRKATWLDRWRARTRPGHWLNQAWREIIIHDSQILSGPHPFVDYPCRVEVKR